MSSKRGNISFEKTWLYNIKVRILRMSKRISINISLIEIFNADEDFWTSKSVSLGLDLDIFPKICVG